MKIKSILVLAILFATTYSFAAENSSIYNTWVLQKIDNKGEEVNYVDFEKSYSVIISNESISFAGSCTPCTISNFTITKSEITYGEDAACVPACCFFKTPQETLMYKPNFEGSFVLNENNLTITNGTIVYYFVAQVNQ